MKHLGSPNFTRVAQHQWSLYLGATSWSSASTDDASFFVGAHLPSPIRDLDLLFLFFFYFAQFCTVCTFCKCLQFFAILCKFCTFCTTFNTLQTFRTSRQLQTTADIRTSRIFGNESWPRGKGYLSGEVGCYKQVRGQHPEDTCIYNDHTYLDLQYSRWRLSNLL